MRRITTPIEDRSLLATENLLRVDSSSSKEVEIPTAGKLFIGGADFCMSVCVSYDDPSIDQAAVFYGVDIPGSLQSVLFGPYFGSMISVVTKQGTLLQGVPNTLVTSNSLNRYTLIRRGSNLEFMFNARSVGVVSLGTDTLDSEPLLNFFIGRYGSLRLDGLVSNLILLSFAPSIKQIQYLHDSNVLPASLHEYAVAHYPLNQNYGAKAYDVVEQYNYAKVAPLTANHGDLINYTAAEIGTDNVLLQTAWQSVYNKSKRGKVFIKGDGVDLYGQVTGYANQNLADWSLYLDFITPAQDVAVRENLFSNQGSGYVPANYCIVGIDPTTQLFILGSALTILNLQKSKRYKLLVVATAGAYTAYLDGVNIGGGTATGFFETFQFFRDPVGNQQFYTSGLCRSVFYSKGLSVRERNLVFNSNLSNEYKSIGSEFDIDFGDVFLDTGNYYARDDSGNDRHAQLFNFAPFADQPLSIEQSTSLPERRKALRFVAANNNYLSVSNFSPTEDKGYTHILGVIKSANTNFAYNSGIICKRDSVNNFKIIFGQSASKEVVYLPANGSSISSGGSPTIDKQNFLVFTERLPNIIKSFFNAVERSSGNGTINSYSSISNATPLVIGAIQDGSGDVGEYFDGYMTFVGIWKGVLTQTQIINIINNGLYGNAAKRLMTDCELYLNFEEIINDAGTYKVKDWSPQNRTVVLNNYTLAEITPGDPDYKLIDVDTLR